MSSDPSLLIRPRLTDYYGVSVTQAEVDFAIPFLEEDIPLYIDPFLLWKSPSQQDNALHTLLTNTFNQIGSKFLDSPLGREEATSILIGASECNEIGLGDSLTRRGKPIGRKLAQECLSIYETVPQVRQAGFVHFEALQLVVDGIARDRVSDFSATFLKSFLIDFTIEQCKLLGIPLKPVKISVFDSRACRFKVEDTELPVHPISALPILLVPKRWLRKIPWIGYDDYYERLFSDLKESEEFGKDRIKILNYNRFNYDLIEKYISLKEKTASDCKNDPLFEQVPVLIAKRKLAALKKLPSGKENNADKKFEDLACTILASLLYPHLDFAQDQVRTVSGVHIRDIIFYNNRSHSLCRELFETYDCKQLIIELKNVAKLEKEHVDQLNRYLSPNFGNMGIILTRNRPPASVLRNTIDLWSGQRRCILILDDSDLELMCEVFDSKQRDPIDLLNKKYREFQRACPS